MEKDRITALTLLYLRKEISSEELIELNEWLDQSPVNRSRFEERINEGKLAESISILEAAEYMKPEVQQQLVWNKEEKPYLSTRKRRWGRMGVAAVLIGLLAIGLDLWLKKPQPIIPLQPALVVQDLPPGGDHATLTLGNGAIITLDSAGKGIVATQGGNQVIKAEDGKLVYQKVNSDEPAVYNTVTTPRGGQHEVTLPDGTKVLLNAESSISFPTAFNGTTREVSMTGQAFFEVAKDKAKPFLVSASGVIVKAIGTQFDVMAYPDEKAIQATLVEGVVRVTKGNSNTLLVPGQQAEVTGNINVSQVNIEEVTAWKNGLFEFNSADIQSVMRQLARWYNVKVRYEGEIPKVRSSGSISRQNTALVVMKVLQESGFHFRIDGDTIVIMP